MFKLFAAMTLATWALAGAAWADEDPGQPLRLIGETPTVGDAGPTRFVIDARAKKGFEGDEVDVDGWFASAAPPVNDSGTLDGKCQHGRCELTAHLEGRTILFTGPMIGLKTAGQGQFEVAGDLAADRLTKGAATFTPFTNTVPGLGDLAPPDGIDSRTLDDLLLWAGINPAFGDDDAHPLEDFQHEHLADWQQANERPINGLLFVADLDMLKTQRDKARKQAGWTALGAADQGWSAGYPAALLTKASRDGAEQRFASADGKASLVIAIDPPISDDAFDKLVDKLISGGPEGRTSHGYTRTGPDMEISYLDAGRATSIIYYHRPGGTARLVYNYPDGDNPYAAMDSIISGSLRVTDALKPAP